MANQYTKLPTQRDIILDYLAAHPACLAREISNDLGIRMTRVSQELAVLQKAKRVIGVKLKGQKAGRWSLDNRPAFPRCEKPKQSYVTNWKGHARDEWTTLFFGAAA